MGPATIKFFAEMTVIPANSVNASLQRGKGKVFTRLTERRMRAVQESSNKANLKREYYQV